MKKTVIILNAILFLANSCGNGQTKTINNELIGEVVIPVEQRQNAEGHDKIEGVAQNDVKDRILSENEVEQLFTDELKRTFDIQYPIFRVYAYSDNLGEYRIVLTENANIQTNNNLNIKAFFFRLEKNTLKKEREVYDSVNSNETSIWFWTKYCSFSDIDHDGLVEPIIVYGSKPEDGAPYRVNILIYYKGEKYAQRHKDGDLDFMRSTQIDKAFYALPKTIQERVKTITDVMIENGHVLEW
jgi:hypothetical protein